MNAEYLRVKRGPCVLRRPLSWYWWRWTSQVTRTGHTVFSGRGDGEAGALPEESLARFAKVFTLHSTLVVKRICRLTSAKRTELSAEPRTFFQRWLGPLLHRHGSLVGSNTADGDDQWLRSRRHFGHQQVHLKQAHETRSHAREGHCRRLSANGRLNRRQGSA